MDGAQTYTKSKILAEKAAWDFVDEKKKKNEPCFELVAINPGYILVNLFSFFYIKIFIFF